MSRLSIGKIPNSLLKALVFSRLGEDDPEVLVGPSIGEDAAVIRHKGEMFAFKSDPITGSVEEIGVLAVYVNANDIASRGAIPRWFMQCILLPQGSTESDLERVCAQIDSAARALKIAVVGGHTEVTDGVSRPIVVGSMIGVLKSERFIATGGCSPGDLLYMTKAAGIEGTVILSSDPKVSNKFGEAFVSRCKSLLGQVNAVNECLLLAESESVTAIHDVTEGGILGCAWELAEASGSGIFVDLPSVKVREETALICKELGLDPYRLMGSGSVLFTVKEGRERLVEEILRSSNIEYSRIGKILPPAEGRVCRDLSGALSRIGAPPSDELWRARSAL